MDALTMALEYQQAGPAPIAVPHASKEAVIRWKRWQDRAPTPADLRAMFSGPSSNIGIVCGRASGNLLVLDCENPPTFGVIGGRLASAGIVTWTVQRPENGSDHDGGGHFWLRTPEPVRSFRLDSLEVRSQGQYVLAPPSAHPCGGLYQFIAKPVEIYRLPSLDALDWLKLEPAASRILSRRAWKLLMGDLATVNRYHSRSEAEAALCASLARAGFSYTDALRLMLRYPGPGKFADMYAENPDNAQRYLYLTWCKAAEFVATHESDAIRLARNRSQWAESRAWPGRTGATDHAVYTAHLSIIEKCGCQPYAASCRELAEFAGVSWDTAAKATHRLRDAGLIELVQDATPSLSHRYRLLEPADVSGLGPCCHQSHHVSPPSVATGSRGTTVRASSDTQSPQNVMECQVMHAHEGGSNLGSAQLMECQAMHAGHDVFRWKGLTKAGMEVLVVLQTRGQAAVREIAEITGRHPSTVRRKLRAMEELSLVEKVNRWIWRFIGGDLDEAAEQLGTAGVGQRQRWQHEIDRLAHRRTLAEGRSRSKRRRVHLAPAPKVEEEEGEIL